LTIDELLGGKNMKKRILTLCVALLMVFALAGCGGSTASSTPAAPSGGDSSEPPASSSEPAASPSGDGVDHTQGDTMTLKLGHMSPLESPFNYYAEAFRDKLQERSGGRISIDIYPASQLGSDRELLEGIQIGTIDMAVNTSSAMTNFVKIYGVLDLPYVITSWDHARAYMASDGAAALFEESKSSDIYTLSMMPRGFRHVFNSLRPINSMEDISGLKLRVVESSVYVDTFNAFGANPQSMAWGEVYTALQQNTIDGMENSYVTVYDYKMHEIQKYGSETSHMFAFAALNINSGVFDSLSESDQQLFRECALEAGYEIGLDQQTEEEHFKQLVQDGGVEINTLDIEPFAAVVQPVYDKFIAENGDTHFNAIVNSGK